MNENHIMYKLFKSFEINNIKYLHFKSNTNLSDSFQGKGDFDVLVDKNEIVKIEKLIAEHNGKRHNPIHVGSYPGVDNWLVFDEEDGKLFHLHLHYQLVTGKKFVKEYVLPWNELLFTTRIKDPVYDIYVTNPNVELVLLAFRSVLKAKFFDFTKKLLGVYRLSKSMQREWDDMYKKSSPSEVEKVVNEVCPIKAELLTDILLKSKLSSFDYLTIHRIVRKTMKLHRRYSGFEATIRSFLYKFEYYTNKVRNRYLNRLSITRKISLQGGLIVAFVGVDGAGKSTISSEISKWMIRKIECKRFYMGTGDGRTTIFASLVKKLIKLNKKKSAIINNKKRLEEIIPNSSKPISFFSNPISFLKKYFKMAMINSVQKNNYNKIVKMNQYRLNGGISVLDRWPQLEICNQNDGPKIVSYKNYFGETRFLRKRIEKEKKYLDIVKTIKPDIIFRLNISTETCLSRKPEHVDGAFFGKKIEELMQLKYQGANIIEVDAEQSYDEELLFIKKVLWQYI